MQHVTKGSWSKRAMGIITSAALVASMMPAGSLAFAADLPSDNNVSSTDVFDTMANGSSGLIDPGNQDDNDASVSFMLDGMLYSNKSSAISGSVAVDKDIVSSDAKTQLSQASLLISKSDDANLANKAVAVPDTDKAKYANIGQQAQVYSITLKNEEGLPTSLSGVTGADSISATVKIALDETTSKRAADSGTYTLKLYNVGGGARQEITGAKVADGYLTFTTTLSNIGSLALVLEHTHSYSVSATTQPSCTTDGATTYTCSVCKESYEKVTSAATGHSYGAWSFSWSSDNKTCTATRKCSKGDSTQTYKSTGVTTKTVAATTTAAGSITYTATFASNTGIAKQTKTTTIAKLEYTSVWRLYNPNNGEHLYTTDANEYKVLASIGWKQEGEAWRSPKSGDAVYRLYNPNSGDHHYTKDLNEYNTLAKLGWKQEGVKFYSSNDSANQVTIYRLFNPNLTAGTHHYTKDANEYKELGRIGWKQENIGFYGIN